MSKPKTIVQQLKPNFRTLKEACKDGNLALVECKRKSDGRVVAMVCAMGWDGKEYQMVPLAEMVYGNPYEMYDPPNPEGGF